MFKTPSKEIFEEMKKAAIFLWKTYDNTYGYVDEKLEKINELENFQDNGMVFFRMFDNMNQYKFIGLVNKETANYILNNQ